MKLYLPQSDPFGHEGLAQEVAKMAFLMSHYDILRYSEEGVSAEVTTSLRGKLRGLSGERGPCSAPPSPPNCCATGCWA